MFKLYFTAIVIMFLAACSSKPKNSGKPKESPPIVVDVLVVNTVPLSNRVEANGSVVANEYAEIRPEVSGRLTYLYIAEGAAVSRGTVLARVNDADLRAQMGKSKTQLNLARKTLDRYKVLVDAGGLNQADYDIVLGQVSAFNADIAYTQALIEKTVIRAPFSGVMGLRQVSPGAYVTPATILATLQQLNTVKLDFTLPDIYSDLVKRGDIVDVILGEDDQQNGRAQITAIEPSASATTRNLKVRANLLGNNPLPGTFVKVILKPAVGKQVVMVPANCIIPDDKNNVIVVVKNNKAAFVPVKTGVRQASLVEITEGISIGDSVVVTGVLFARPDAVLKVRGTKTLADIMKADSTAY